MFVICLSLFSRQKYIVFFFFFQEIWNNHKILNKYFFMILRFVIFMHEVPEH